jgi:hypothetical protein
LKNQLETLETPFGRTLLPTTSITKINSPMPLEFGESRNKGTLNVKGLTHAQTELAFTKNFSTAITPSNMEKRLRVKPLLAAGNIKKTEKAH